MTTRTLIVSLALLFFGGAIYIWTRSRDAPKPVEMTESMATKTSRSRNALESEEWAPARLQARFQADLSEIDDETQEEILDLASDLQEALDGGASLRSEEVMVYKEALQTLVDEALSSEAP